VQLVCRWCAAGVPLVRGWCPAGVLTVAGYELWYCTLFTSGTLTQLMLQLFVD